MRGAERDRVRGAEGPNVARQPAPLRRILTLHPGAVIPASTAPARKRVERRRPRRFANLHDAERGRQERAMSVDG